MSPAALPTTSATWEAHVKLVRQIGIGALAGAIAGVLVAGIGGRIAMRVIAVAESAEPGFTISGTFFAVVALALLAMPFAVAYVLAGQHLSAAKWRAAALGGLYFLLLAGLSLVRPSGSGLGELEIAPILGTALFAGVLALNGIAVHELAVRFERTLPPAQKTIRSILGYGVLTTLAGFGVVSVALFFLST